MTSRRLAALLLYARSAKIVASAIPDHRRWKPFLL